MAQVRFIERGVEHTWQDVSGRVKVIKSSEFF